jgi:diguanylate cyclase (GGDEF)-like protein
MKVLLYDSDDVHLHLLKDNLNQEDYSLVVEQDALKLFDHLEGDAPELIISNFNQYRGGVDLVNAVLARLEPPFPYILFLTEDHSETLAVNCLGPIPGDFISTPLRPEEFRARIIVAEKAIALQNLLRAQKDYPSDIALYDPLTNVLNRQAVYERGLVELNRSQRQKTPVCLAMVELVNAAEIARQNGEGISNQAIRFVARAIRANLRLYDVVGRWMDGRFMLVLPGLPIEHTRNVIERIVRAIQSVRIRSGEQDQIDLVIAAGYTWSDQGEALPLVELIHRASSAIDQATMLEHQEKLIAYSEVIR